MNYELKNGVVMFDLCTNRPVANPDRRRSRSVVWPAQPANMPGIPFGTYTEHVNRVFREADAANARVEKHWGPYTLGADGFYRLRPKSAQEYCDELNAQRKIHEPR